MGGCCCCTRRLLLLRHAIRAWDAVRWCMTAVLMLCLAQACQHNGMCSVPAYLPGVPLLLPPVCAALQCCEATAAAGSSRRWHVLKVPRVAALGAQHLCNLLILPSPDDHRGGAHEGGRAGEEGGCDRLPGSAVQRGAGGAAARGRPGGWVSGNQLQVPAVSFRVVVGEVLRGSMNLAWRMRQRGGWLALHLVVCLGGSAIAAFICQLRHTPAAAAARCLPQRVCEFQQLRS